MKKSIIISLASVLFAGTALTSCSDFLDGAEQNRSNIDVSSVTADQMVVYANKKLQQVFNGTGVLPLFVKGTDLYINAQNSAINSEFNDYSLSSDNSTVRNLYSSLYNVINYSNGAIELSGDPNDKAACEARFMRDFCYYELIQHFGRVPYITKYIESSETNYPRTDLATIYDGLIQDLTDVYNNGSLDEVNHQGHASKAAVAALLSKVCLAAGWDLDTQVTDIESGAYTVLGKKDYFKQAENWASNCISTTGLGLCPTFEQKWAPSNQGNQEEIYSVQFSRKAAEAEGTVNSSGNNWAYGFSGYYQTAKTKFQKNMNHQDNPTKKVLALYDKTDSRFDGTFMTTMYSGNTWGTAGYYAYYKANAAQKTDAGILLRFLPNSYLTDGDVQAIYKNERDDIRHGAANSLFNKKSYIVVMLGEKVKIYSIDETSGNVIDGATITSKEYDYYTNTSTGTYSGFLSKTTELETSGGLACKKWDDPEADIDATSGNTFRNVPLFTVSDILLIRAEAKLMQGDMNYIDDVNAVRTRANAMPIHDLAAYQPKYNHTFTIRDIDIILDERAIELFAEYTRWEDLRRTKQLVLYNKEFNIDYSAAKMGTGANAKVLRPIPSDEMGSNTGIAGDQNPGY